MGETGWGRFFSDKNFWLVYLTRNVFWSKGTFFFSSSESHEVDLRSLFRRFLRFAGSIVFLMFSPSISLILVATIFLIWSWALERLILNFYLLFYFLRKLGMFFLSFYCFFIWLIPSIMAIFSLFYEVLEFRDPLREIFYWLIFFFTHWIFQDAKICDFPLHPSFAWSKWQSCLNQF